MSRSMSAKALPNGRSTYPDGGLVRQRQHSGLAWLLSNGFYTAPGRSGSHSAAAPQLGVGHPIAHRCDSAGLAAWLVRSRLAARKSAPSE